MKNGGDTQGTPGTLGYILLCFGVKNHYKRATPALRTIIGSRTHSNVASETSLAHLVGCACRRIHGTTRVTTLSATNGTPTGIVAILLSTAATTMSSGEIIAEEGWPERNPPLADQSVAWGRMAFESHSCQHVHYRTSLAVSFIPRAPLSPNSIPTPSQTLASLVLPPQTNPTLSATFSTFS